MTTWKSKCPAVTQRQGSVGRCPAVLLGFGTRRKSDSPDGAFFSMRTLWLVPKLQCITAAGTGGRADLLQEVTYTNKGNSSRGVAPGPGILGAGATA